MGIRLLIISLCALPNLGWAQDYACEGAQSDWSLALSATGARFDYLDRATDLSIPQQSVAEGAQWPRAYTLIGPRDSAILIITDQSCATAEYSAHVLTQRGETPVLLTGCCVRTDRP